YKFDEEGGTVAADSSINGQFGVANVGIARCLGMYGGALNMGGSDFVTVPSLGEQTSLTIAAWVNPHTLNSDLNSIVCSNGENSALQATIARSGEICLAINGNRVAASDFKFTPETLGWWKPIAIAYDSSAKSVSFYVDGKLDCTRTLTEAPKLDLSSGLKVGGGAAGVRGLDGEIDDFQLYAKAISAAEIAEMSKPTNFPSIADVKKLNPGTVVTLMGKVVTYAPMDPMTFERTTRVFYISERDGSAGIEVDDGDAGQDKVKPDTCVSLTGKLMRGHEGQVGISLISPPSLGAPYTAKYSDIREANALIKIKGDIVEVSEDGRKFTIDDGKTRTKAIVDKGMLIKKVSKGNTVEVTGILPDVFEGDGLLVKELVRINPPPAPILAHYTFDETSGNIAKDSSGNGYDATLANNATWVSGKIGGAVCLDGKKSYVQLPDLGFQPALTIALWVNETSLGSDDWSTALVHADGWNIGDLHWQIPCKQGNIGAAINGAGDVNSNFVFVGNTNKWVHVAFTYDAKARNMAIYVDGKLENARGMGEARPINLSHSKLGSWGGNSRFFDGKFDDLRIYDRALSAGEIAKLYNGN
ncbi:MAG: LamG domain-containing protein, partial [Armatimonadetes bacterium]|nr:LamG domain-containing protein [Armatimonadota bacterium]